MDEQGLPTVEHWHAGARWAGKAERHGDVHDPATGRVARRVVLASAADVDEVVAGAAVAGREWGAASVTRRTAVLFAFREALARRSREVAEAMTAEHV